MQEKVEAFIQKCADEKRLEEKSYRDRVLRYAGFLSENINYVEVSKKEYDACGGITKKEDGKYYIQRKTPVVISDEEFEAIEKAIPDEKLAELRLEASGAVPQGSEKSWAATFFTIIAWLIWIVGLVISIVGAKVTVVKGSYYTYQAEEFNFTVFITAFITYFIYGCLALCAAELFKKMQTIVNLLKRK